MVLRYSVRCTRYLRCGAARLLRVSVVLLFVTALFISQSFAAAKSIADEEAVEVGKQALSRVARFPWYDRAKDAARPLSVLPRDDADSENRGSKWTNTAPVTGGKTPTLNRWSYFGPVLQTVGLSALLLLLGLIAFMVARAFLHEELSESSAARKIVEAKRDADRVQALPLKVPVPAGDFLQEARRLYEAGRFSEAIIYLFSHQLLELDKHHCIRLAKGKTNRQYLRELRLQPTLAAILETTVVAFEEAFFGHKSLPRESFEKCWGSLDEFDQQLQHREQIAA